MVHSMVEWMMNGACMVEWMMNGACMVEWMMNVSLQALEWCKGGRREACRPP